MKMELKNIYFGTKILKTTHACPFNWSWEITKSLQWMLSIHFALQNHASLTSHSIPHFDVLIVLSTLIRETLKGGGKMPLTLPTLGPLLLKLGYISQTLTLLGTSLPK